MFPGMSSLNRSSKLNARPLPPWLAGTSWNDAVSGSREGPATVAESELDSGRPSGVQIASAAEQSVVAASDTVTFSNDCGRTVIVQRWFWFGAARAHAGHPAVRRPQRLVPELLVVEATREVLAEAQLEAELAAPAAVAGRHVVERRRQRLPGCPAMVPVASATATRARQAFESASVNVSSPSASPSSSVTTATVFVRSPALERQRAGRRLVVLAGGRGAVGGRVIHGDVHVHRGVERHVELERAALRHLGVCHAHLERGRPP